MEPRIAQNLIALLTSDSRVTLKPSDMPAYGEALNALRVIARGDVDAKAERKEKAPEGAREGDGKENPVDGVPGLTD
jgi:hypothetical protein